VRRHSAAAVVWLTILVSLGAPAAFGADRPGSPSGLPDFRLSNWDGREVSRASLEGQRTIAVFTYAKCIFACPMITFLLGDLDSDLGSPADLRYLHISVNSKEDTGAEIREHFRKHDIDPVSDPRWLFLNGPDTDIARLLDDLDIDVEKRDVEGGWVIEHTIRVYVLGPDTNTITSFDTFHWPREEMLHALQSTLQP